MGPAFRLRALTWLWAVSLPAALIFTDDSAYDFGLWRWSLPIALAWVFVVVGVLTWCERTIEEWEQAEYRQAHPSRQCPCCVGEHESINYDTGGGRRV